MNLKSEQRRLYDLLPKDAHCFLRVCDDDGALWVSDFPRKHENHQALTGMLSEAGFSVRTDNQSLLWYVDWTHERWQELMQRLPERLPAFPENEQYHELYALCRLLMLHPAPVEKEHLPMLRRILKLTAERPQSLLKSARRLHEETACRLRKKQTAAYAAGRLLSAWLDEHANNGKETKP